VSEVVPQQRTQPLLVLCCPVPQAGGDPVGGGFDDDGLVESPAGEAGAADHAAAPVAVACRHAVAGLEQAVA
jgi:hypothetical protein